MARIRIVIADDHALLRSAFRSMLETKPDLVVVGEAVDGVEVVEVCRRLMPDVVLMDLTMPGRGGIAAIAEIRKLIPDTRVIAVTMQEDEVYVRQAWLAGASGFVLKTALADELIRAIRKVAAGHTHFSISQGDALGQTPAFTQIAQNSSPLQLLTPREQEVASLVALGHTTQEISRRLHVCEKTVESHRKHLMEKLGFLTRAEVVHFALEHRLI